MERVNGLEDLGVPGTNAGTMVIIEEHICKTKRNMCTPMVSGTIFVFGKHRTHTGVYTFVSEGAIVLAVRFVFDPK